jgi:hypothetical protein
VQKWTPTPTGNSTYGMAYDPLRQTILACGQNGTPNTLINMVAYEFDPARNTFLGNPETGARFLSCDMTISGTNPGGLSGGCSIHIEKRKVPTLQTGVFNTIDVPVLTWLSQATSDSVVQMIGRFQQHPYDGAGNAMATNSGGTTGAIFESSQGRFTTGPWANWEAYSRNSPVFHAAKVKTPLVILHNDQDGAVDFTQGVEYFNTLRRLDKPVVMLEYPGENHGLARPANQQDYTVRMKEFFDHYLKGAPAPDWWKNGVSRLDMQEHIDGRLKAREEEKKKRAGGGGGE